MADVKPPSKTKAYLIVAAITFTCLVFLLIIPTIIIVVNSRHTIEEGNVGIYYVNGALQEPYTFPGTHWSIPFVTEVERITVRPITTRMKNIRTITLDGVVSTFKGIHVISGVNTGSVIPLIRKFGLEFREVLIFDGIAQELQKFCANHTLSLIHI